MPGKVELKKKKERQPISKLELKMGLDKCNHWFQI